MTKMNKKGFTLIEMLVVIAIIAVLVSIVVPTVSKSTTKAAAATDAANLRSAQATLTILAMDDKLAEASDPAEVTTTILGSTVPVCKTTSTDKMMYTYSKDAGVVVTFGDNGISYFATIAEGKTSTDTE